MSAPAPQRPSGGDEERRKSIGKYVKRLSSVLRRGSSKDVVPKASSSSTPPKPTEPEAAASNNPPVEKAVDPSAAEKQEPIAVTTSAGPSSVPGAYARNASQQERARALFAKYGLTLEAHEWITTGSANTNVQRVEKPIRMRVHRNCHRCGTTFGAERICAKCEHKRCTKCPRYPPKKDSAAKEAKGKGKVVEGAKEEEAEKKPRKHQLTIKSKTGGELVYQPVRQRIRRTCHKCETLFIPPTATTCENCQHVRCTKCPRDPAKPKKWPNGYPGDVPYEASDDEPTQPTRPERTWRKPRQRVRWTCSECKSLFLESKICGKCNHERCDKCTREPPKKVKKEFDPELVKRVEEKIKALTVQPSGAD